MWEGMCVSLWSIFSSKEGILQTKKYLPKKDNNIASKITKYPYKISESGKDFYEFKMWGIKDIYPFHTTSSFHLKGKKLNPEKGHTVYSLIE